MVNAYENIVNESLHFGVLWNLSLALEYDFLTEITNYYPANFPFNEKSKVIKDLRTKEEYVRDLKKEIKIYKSALGIKVKNLGRIDFALFLSTNYNHFPYF